jgi:hypothetical protein
LDIIDPDDNDEYEYIQDWDRGLAIRVPKRRGKGNLDVTRPDDHDDNDEYEYIQDWDRGLAIRVPKRRGKGGNVRGGNGRGNGRYVQDWNRGLANNFRRHGRNNHEEFEGDDESDYESDDEYVDKNDYEDGRKKVYYYYVAYRYIDEYPYTEIIEGNFPANPRRKMKDFERHVEECYGIKSRGEYEIKLFEESPARVTVYGAKSVYDYENQFGRTSYRHQRGSAKYRISNKRMT